VLRAEGLILSSMVILIRVLGLPVAPEMLWGAKGLFHVCRG